MKMSEQLLMMKTFILEHPTLVTWSGVALLILLSIFLQREKIKEAISEWNLQRLLKNIGKESMHDIVIPDDIDGDIFVEHLILLPHEIFILGVKNYRGLIFAAEKIDLWTQVIGNKSYKFENPLHQLEANVIALNSKIEKSKIGKKVLFINASEFPKGKPENIVSVEDIKQWDRKHIIEYVPVALQKDWATLSALALNNELGKEQDVLLDGESNLGARMFSLFSLIVVISLWLFLRLM